MMHPIRALLSVIALIWLTACGGSDSSTPQSSTNQSPTTAQEPTKPPPTTQPPNQAPPSTQPPGSTPPGSGSGGGFTQGTGFNSFVRSIVIADDGTNDLYVGGDFTTYNGTAANHLIRLRPNGTAAQTFGQGFDEVVIALALARDGSHALYAGGAFTQLDGQPVRPVVRLTPAGIRDGGFQAATLLDFTPIALVVPDDGSGDLYIGGNIVRAIPMSPAELSIGRLAKLNQDGSSDSSFPTVVEMPGPGDDTSPVVTGLAPVPGTGKVYVGGDIGLYNGQPVSSPLRLNPNGSVDSTFMTGTGTPQLPQTNGTEVIALAGNGSRDLYAGGRISSYNGTMMTTFGSIRIQETGALDTSFVPAIPMITFTIAPAEDGTGDVFVYGLETGSGIFQSRLLRLSRNGALVSTFHEPSLDSQVLTIVPVLDGTRDLYIGGTFTTYNGVPVNHIARIRADGSLASVVN